MFKTAPDYETDPHSYQVEVSAFDGVNTTAKTITVNLTDVNEAPTAVALANATASIFENTSTASTSRWRTSLSPTMHLGATHWR